MVATLRGIGGHWAGVCKGSNEMEGAMRSERSKALIPIDGIPGRRGERVCEIST